MYTDESFMALLQSLDRRAQENKSYGFRQNLWSEIIDELEFLNDVIRYIDETVPGIADEAAEAVQKAREK